MGKKKFTADQIGQFRAFLGLKWSLSRVRDHFKNKGVDVSVQYLSKIRQGKENVIRHKENETRGRKPKLTPDRMRTLTAMTNSVNPPTQRDMAARLNVSPTTVRNGIKKLGRRMVKKPKVHAMTEETIQKRHRRSWPLYQMLKNDRCLKVVTSDEAWVYLRESQGKRDVQYITKSQRRGDAEVNPRANWPVGLMVWIAFSASGFFTPIFVDKGAKINSKYYCHKVMRPFSKELKQRYPDDDYLFHHDSAPAHASKYTRKYLKDNGIRYITPDQWMPSSPDCAPCDYWLWGYLKSKLNKRRIKTIIGLKRAIREEVQKIPPEMIVKALRAWPKRCRMIYYAKGQNIENKK
jgi:hypothetical protein